MPISFVEAGVFSGVDGGPNVLNNPTSLQFGPDGRLYVAEQNGTINAFTVSISNGEYIATDHEVLTLAGGQEVVKSIQNHNDDGSLNGNGNRQVTGIVVAGTAENPVLYVTSSDPRISQNGDDNLDTNSGVLTQVTWNGTDWEAIDLIRGMPRSEENHATNGMVLSPDGNTLYLNVGGNTNNGAPSSFFSYTAEYTLSGTVLEIDLVALDNMATQTDPAGGQGGTARQYKYDLPTLDDPNIPNDGVREDANGMDVAGPWGGNDGLNQAVLPADAPLRIYADGFRNHYDIAMTSDGRLYTVDNGSNGGLGGNPITESNDDDGDGIPGEAINKPNNGGSGDPEPLFLIEEGGYYGHPAPVRANQNQSWTVYDDDGNPDTSLSVNTVADISTLVPDVLDIEEGFLIDPSKFAALDGLTPEEIEARLLQSGERIERSTSETNSIVNVGSSTNGIVVYDSGGTAFDGVLDGKLFVTQFNDNITLLNIDDAGTGLDPVMEEGPDGIFGTADDVVQAGGADGILEVANNSLGIPLANPLDVTVGPDGTLWVAEIGGNEITVLAPSELILPGDNDSDDDGILNVDDPFLRDPQNGLGVVIVPNTEFLWDFDPNQDGNLPGPDGFGGGLTGVMIDGVTDYEAFFQSPSNRPGQIIQLDNVKFITAAGGGTTVIEEVSGGDPFQGSNSGEFLFHTGVSLAPNVDEVTFTWSVFNPGTAFSGNFQQIGGYIGTGDQSNYLKVVAIQNNGGELQVTLEDDDTVASTQLIQADDLFDVDPLDNKKIFFSLTVDKQTGASDVSVTYETATGETTVNSTPFNIAGSAVFDAINGNNSAAGEDVGLAVGLFSSNAGQPDANTFQAIFDDITITATEAQLPPEATDDATSAQINQTIVIPVAQLLANDSDPNSDPLTVESISNIVNGSAVLDDNGTPDDSGDDFITFTPDLDFEGTASFDYTISDGTGEDTGSVSINVSDITVLYRVNAGGAEIAALPDDPFGSTLAWAANTGNGAQSGPGFSVNTGNVSTHNIGGRATTGEFAVPTYVPQGIFAQERWDPASGPEMEFQFGEGTLPVGTYTVNLFAGNGFGGTSEPGERVFDVNIEGESAFTSVDLSALLGHQVGGMFTWTGLVDDGTLNIEWIHDIENPTVNGIEILGGAFTPEPDPIQVSIVNGGAQTVSEGDGLVQISILTDQTVPADQTVDVTFQIESGTATPGSGGDYEYTGGGTFGGGTYTDTVSIAGSSSDVQIPISILEDLEIETGETFTVTLTSVSENAEIGTVSSTTVTIQDNDTPPGAVVAAINAGGPALTQDGIDFVADQFFLNGSTFTDGSNFDINNGNGVQESFDGTIFETERFGGSGGGSLNYAIPVTAGLYDVELYFAEIFQPGGSGDGIGARVFDVFVEGQLVLDDFDILAETGGDFNQPIIFSVPTSVDPTSFGDAGLLEISLSASADNAKISGIVVRSADPGYTPPNDDLFGTSVEISDDRLAPTDGGTLGLGENLVSATQEGENDGLNGVRDRDYFTFTVPEGQVLTGIVLDGFTNDNPLLTQGFIAIQQGTQITVDPATGQPDPDTDPLLGGLIYNSGFVGQDLLGIMAQGGDVQAGFPLDPFTPGLTGDVTVWLNQGAGPSTVDLNFIVQDVAGEMVYLQNEDGNFVIEAEDAADDGPGGWEFHTTDNLPEGHEAPSGGEYIEATGNNFNNPNGASILTYKFKPLEDGFVRINLVASHQGNSTEENDSWTGIQLDGVTIPALDQSVPLEPKGNLGLYKTFSSGGGANDFILANKNVDFNGQPIVVPVQAGRVYDFLLGERSAEHEVDKIVLEFFQNEPNGLGNQNNIKNQELSPKVTLVPQDPVGEAVLTINENGNNIESSNFGNNSFQITNTGDKDITAIEIDVTDALLPDAVFDPLGIAGDLTFKNLTINTEGGTGVITPPGGFDADAIGVTYLGSGGILGFETIRLEFTDFNPGETLGFSVDMDPNSIAGAEKGPLDSGAPLAGAGGNNLWDVGGIGGAELINSLFTVTYDDDTTSTGELQGQGAGQQIGAKALSSQDSENLTVNLLVNGLTEGSEGTYDTGGPTVTVEGPAGEIARVVLAKGFIVPFTNEFPDTADPNEYHDQLDAQLAALAASGFPANNIVEFQYVDVLLDGTVQDITSMFDFTDVDAFDLSVPGLVESELPLGFAASVIDTNTDLSKGAVTDPIHLTFSDEPVLSADLSLEKVVSDPTPIFGDTITFSLTVSNDGPDQAANVSVEDVLASGYTFVEATGDGSYDESTGLWTVGTIDSGSTANIEIQAIVNASGAGSTETVLHRINVGGPAVDAADGSDGWTADNGASPSPFRVSGSDNIFTGNAGSAHPGPIILTDPSVPAYAPAAIYNTERFDLGAAPEMKWEFAIDPGTEVEVRLHFAELFNGIDAAGERVFDVSVEGVVPASFDDIDAFMTAGPKGAFMRTTTLTVDDGTLDIEFIHVTENPALKGIEIIELGSAPAEYDNYAQILTSDLPDPDSTPGDGSVGDDDDATVTVTPTAVPQNQLSIIASADAAEPGTTGQFTVSLEEAAATDTVITYSIAGTATGGTDYETLSGMVTILQGELTALIDVTVIDDLDLEGDESVVVTLTEVTSGDADVVIGATDEATVALVDDEVPPTQASALIEITPGSNLAASTFGASSFQITNTSLDPVTITSVSIDLSTAILPDMVFDPTGAGGDATAGGFTPNSGATATGLIAPGDPLVDPFSAPRNGGFDIITVEFTDFDSSEAFFFTTDVDPNSIQGVPGAGNSGAVSGYELIGSTVTVTFDDGTILTGSLYEDGSLGGGQAILVNEPQSIAPEISLVGGGPDRSSLPGDQVSVLSGDVDQTILITGTPGDNVSLLQMDARLFIASGNDPFDVQPDELPFYANEALSKTLFSGVIGLDGTLEIPVTLLSTPTGSGPTGGLNHFVAVTSAVPYAVDQAVSQISNTLVINQIDGNEISVEAVTDAAEPDQNGQFLVSLTAVSEVDTVISYLISGTATDGVDYAALTGTVTILAGELSAPIDVTVIDDLDFEGDETVVITLDQVTASDGIAVIGANASAEMALVDDEISVDLELSKTISDETPEFGQEVTFTLTVDNLDLIEDATNVVVTDLLPGGYTYLGDSSGGVDYDDETGIWTVGTIAAGETATLEITALVEEVLEQGSGLETLYRINVGGGTQTAEGGIGPDWFGSGPVVGNNNNTPADVTTGVQVTFGQDFGNDNTIGGGGVPNTVDLTAVSGTGAPEAVFRSERFKSQEWDFLVDPGEYIVNLYFAEIFVGVQNNGGAGDRIFDVSIEGNQVLDDYDVFATAGGGRIAIVESFDVTVEEGDTNLDIDFANVPGGDNAKISAIEIIRVGEDGIDQSAYVNFAEITASDQFDFDSTPGNGTAPTPAEDDEAVVAPTVSAPVPTLTLTIDPVSIVEDGGVATATVSRNIDTIGDLVVTLVSDDPTAATVPVSVIIPDGQASVTFDVTAVDDSVVDGTQTPTITASAAGFVDGTASLDVTDDDFVVGATVEISGNTTFGTSAFVITNTSEAGVKIKNVTFDIVPAVLSVGLDASGAPGSEFLGSVFDPTGEAGDAGSQGLKFTDNAAGLVDDLGQVLAPQTSALGFVGDAGVYPFTGQLPGGNAGAPGGFRFMTLDFATFENALSQPPVAFQFGVDVDPQSIQAATGTGEAGAVSGAELAGMMVTIEFEGPGGETIIETRQLAATGFESSAAVFDGSGPGSAPVVEVLGLVEGADPRRAVTTDPTHDVKISGLTEGDMVELQIFDASGYEKHGGDGTAAVADDPFHANQFDAAPTVLTATADATGMVTFQIDLSGGASGAAPATVDDLFFLTAAVTDGAGTVTSLLSDPIELRLVDNTAPTITSPAEVDYVEGDTSVAYIATAVDPEMDDIILELGGVDAEFFDFNDATGEVTFVSPPDFENPLDTDGDNVFDITISASDGLLGTAQDVKITVLGDTDGDLIPDNADNAIFVANPDQRDTNGDGYGNVIDFDLNNDGQVDSFDAPLFVAAFGSIGPDLDADFNGDGQVDSFDAEDFVAGFGQFMEGLSFIDL
ncbi:MAG: malectin domain-containing carbohydrate-binding protein [Pseudomonadota bacterium]